MHAHRVVGDRRLLLRDKEWNTERVRRLRRRADVEEGIGRGDERVELPLHEGTVEQAQETARVFPAVLVQVVASIRLQPGTDLFREDLSASRRKKSNETTRISPPSPSSSRRLSMSGPK